MTTHISKTDENRRSARLQDSLPIGVESADGGQDDRVIVKNRKGESFDLSDWVDTGLFQMALYAVDKRNALINAVEVQNYMLGKLVEFASLALFTPIDVRGDGSCALHAFHARCMHLGT